MKIEHTIWSNTQKQFKMYIIDFWGRTKGRNEKIEGKRGRDKRREGDVFPSGEMHGKRETRLKREEAVVCGEKGGRKDHFVLLLIPSSAGLTLQPQSVACLQLSSFSEHTSRCVHKLFQPFVLPVHCPGGHCHLVLALLPSLSSPFISSTS